MNHTLATAAGNVPRRWIAVLAGWMLVLIATGLAGAGDPPPGDLPPEGPRVVAWPSGPLEVIAASEHPFAPAEARAMIGRTIVYEGPVANRLAPILTTGPSYRLRIVGARLQDDDRTLVLATDPHPVPARYVLPLPSEGTDPASKGPRLPGRTVTYDLSGVEAAWSEGDAPAAEPKWSGWWPALDPDATRRFTRGSRPHEQGLALLDRPGRLILSAWLRLPEGQALVRIRSTRPIEEVLLGDAQAAAQATDPEGRFLAELAVASRGEPLFLTMTVRTGDRGQTSRIESSYRIDGEKAGHPIGRGDLLLPWVPTPPVAAITAPLTVPDLSGGDPERGRTIFRGDQARCSSCHALRGEGGKVGPDLTDVAARGRAEIYRSIAAPSAAIAPDYTSYTVSTRDGRVFSGVVRAEGPDTIQVTDTNAKVSTIRRDEIQEIRPSATSIMPPGLAAALGDSAVRDLIAYLTSPAPPSVRNR